MVVSFFLTHLLLEVASPIIFLLHSAAIKLQEAKDSIDEEDPRPTSSMELHHVVSRASSSR